MNTITIQLNGEEKKIDPEITLAQLIQYLELDGKHIAIELNENIIPKSQLTQTSLQQGDQLELVTAIGGG